MHILILYGTVEGQTRKIAHYVSDHIQKLGHTVEIMDATVADRPIDVEPVSAVIALCPVHAGKLTKPFTHVISTNHAGLMARPGFLGIVSMAAATKLNDDMHELNLMAEDFSEDTGWWPVVSEHIAGALKYTEYDFFKKWIMKRIASSYGGSTDTSTDTEYTDWNQLEAAINQFLHDVPDLQNKI